MIPTRRDDADDATPTTTRAMEDATTADATTDDEMNRTNRSVPRATSVREKIALYDGADEAAKARTRANDEESSVSRETVAKLRASDLEEALTRAFDAFGSFGRRRDAETRMDGARFAKLCKEVIFKGGPIFCGLKKPIPALASRQRRRQMLHPCGQAALRW